MAKSSGSNRYSAVETMLGSKSESTRELGERTVNTQWESMRANLFYANKDGRIPKNVMKQINAVYRKEGDALGALQGAKGFHHKRNKLMDEIASIIIKNKIKLR